jgi:hypothetical protein
MILPLHATPTLFLSFFFFFIKNHGLKLLTAVNEKKLKNNKNKNNKKIIKK